MERNESFGPHKRPLHFLLPEMNEARSSFVDRKENASFTNSERDLPFSESFLRNLRISQHSSAQSPYQKPNSPHTSILPSVRSIQELPFNSSFESSYNEKRVFYSSKEQSLLTNKSFELPKYHKDLPPNRSFETNIPASRAKSDFDSCFTRKRSSLNQSFNGSLVTPVTQELPQNSSFGPEAIVSSSYFGGDPTNLVSPDGLPFNSSYESILNSSSEKKYPRNKGTSKYVCPACPATFAQKSHLECHVSAIHLKLKPFSCEHCKYKAARKSDMNKHVKIVHDKKLLYICDHCGAQFPQKSNLNRHIQRLHKTSLPISPNSNLSVQSPPESHTSVLSPKTSIENNKARSNVFDLLN